MGSAEMLLKHTSKPLDPPLIELFCIADHDIIFFCKLTSNLHVPNVMERKHLQ